MRPARAVHVIQSKRAPSLISPPIEKTAAVINSEKPSPWLWVPYIWLFFTSTRALSSWISGGRTGLEVGLNATGSPLDRLLMTLLIVLGLFALRSRGEQTRRILAKNKWVVALLIFIALSILWSNFPGISLRRGFRSLGAFVMVLVVLTERNPANAVQALLRRLYFAHIPLSIIAIKYFRNFGILYNWNGSEEEWTGISTDKNSLGQVAMFSGLFCVWQILKDWPKKGKKWNLKKVMPSVLLLFPTFWLLRGSKNVHSSTAIVGFAISSIVLIGLQFVKKRSAHAKRIILAGCIGLIIFTPLLYVAFQAFETTPVEMVLQATGRNMTLTDRTLIWADVMNNAAKSPLLGVGIGAFWVGPIGYDMYPLPNWSRKTPQWRPEEAHNGFIDVYVQLGAVGVVLLFIVIGIAVAGALTHLESDFQYGSLRLTLLLSIIVSNITETSFLDGTHGLWFLFLLTSVNIPISNRKTSAKKDRALNHLDGVHIRGLQDEVLQPLFRVDSFVAPTAPTAMRLV